jgi:membrane-bound lytic murein transglycosylase B
MTHRAGFFWLLAASLIVTPALASVDRSLFPRPRPGVGLTGTATLPAVTALRQMPGELLAPRLAPTVSLVPTARPDDLTVPRDETFARWLADFRIRALAEGIRASTFDRAFAGVEPNQDILDRESRQPEFTRPIWEYLDSAVSESRLRDGRAMLREHERLLDAIEARYDVDREMVIAVWGLESAYGRLRGRTEIIPALATLAMSSRRARFYEAQLVGALQILQAGDVRPEQMVGSWAGAMGHTQFIPTSYLAYAVDFTGDGRRDIWSDDPADSLASTAAYLARHGWERGQPWGVEVLIPRGFNPRLANTSRDLREWVALGIAPQPGHTLPSNGEAQLLFPAGSEGPAFLALRNFRVIKRYNNADAYAIAVGHLADRLRGAGEFVADWPRGDRPLSRAEREELQRVLQRAGLYAGDIDGRVGSGTLAAVRDWQAANGLAPDGYVSLALLQRMRRR